MALGVVDALDTAVNDHRRIFSVMPGKDVAQGRVTPLEDEAAAGQVARHPVVATIGHVLYEQNLLGHRTPPVAIAAGGECITAPSPSFLVNILTRHSR